MQKGPCAHIPVGWQPIQRRSFYGLGNPPEAQSRGAQHSKAGETSKPFHCKGCPRDGRRPSGSTALPFDSWHRRHHPNSSQTPTYKEPSKHGVVWAGKDSNSPQLQGPAVGRLPPTGSGCPGPHPTRLSSASPARGELRVWALGAQPNPQRWVGVRKAEKPTGMEEEETSSSRGGIRFPSSAGTARPRQATKRLHARSPGSVSRGARHQRGRRRPNAGYGTSPGRPGNASGCNAAAPQRDEPRTEPEPPRSGTPQPVSPFRSSGKGHRERTTKAAELRNSKSAPRGGKKEYRIKMKEPKKKPSPQPGCTHPPPAEGAPRPRRALPVRRAATRRGPCAAAQLGSAQRGTAGSGAAAAAGRGAVHKSGRKR